MVHLVFYFMLFTYLPFTKFAHIIYRTLALTHARQTGRLPASRLPAQAEVP
jgi:quinone-modifying oxidoreductase subunit QmoC